MKPRFFAVTLAVSSLALAGNAWGQSQSGQKQKSSMDTFLQWSSEQVNQLRNSCSRWMADLDRRRSDSDPQLRNSAVPPTNQPSARQNGMGQGQQPASGQGMGTGRDLGTGGGRGSGSGQGMGTGTAFGTGGGRGSGSGPASALGNASGRGKRGNSTNRQGSRGQGNGRRGSGKGQGKKVGS